MSRAKNIGNGKRRAHPNKNLTRNEQSARDFNNHLKVWRSGVHIGLCTGPWFEVRREQF